MNANLLLTNWQMKLPSYRGTLYLDVEFVLNKIRLLNENDVIEEQENDENNPEEENGNQNEDQDIFQNVDENIVDNQPEEINDQNQNENIFNEVYYFL